jgi:hypothetical protein
MKKVEEKKRLSPFSYLHLSGGLIKLKVKDNQ